MAQPRSPTTKQDLRPNSLPGITAARSSASAADILSTNQPTNLVNRDPVTRDPVNREPVNREPVTRIPINVNRNAQPRATTDPGAQSVHINSSTSTSQEATDPPAVDQSTSATTTVPYLSTLPQQPRPYSAGLASSAVASSTASTIPIQKPSLSAAQPTGAPRPASAPSLPARIEANATPSTPEHDRGILDQDPHLRDLRDRQARMIAESSMSSAFTVPRHIPVAATPA